MTRASHRQSVLFVLFMTLFVFYIFVQYQKTRPDSLEEIQEAIGSSNLSENHITAYFGKVSMDELNRNVYKKFGYDIRLPTYPIPTLRMMHIEPTCDEVFAEWLKISAQPQPFYPPKKIPENREKEFLLNRYMAVNQWYINDKNSKTGEKPRGWDKISELMRYSKEKLANLAYGKVGLSMYHAMQWHRLDGQTGVVIGSMQPWVEVSALRNGAAKVLTVEYNPLEIEKDYAGFLSSTLTADFVADYRKFLGSFDFAASFSSIEHSGLGRYGDPLDAMGDVREMLKIKCILRKGGLLFLGLPLGTDALSYNAHRIYGPIRLAMMFYGFEWINTFSGESLEPFDMKSEHFHSHALFHHKKQHTMVLRKL